MPFCDLSDVLNQSDPRAKLGQLTIFVRHRFKELLKVNLAIPVDINNLDDFFALVVAQAIAKGVKKVLELLQVDRSTAILIK